MITEDYVSLETAKLLKERGFDEECTIAYFNETLVDYTMFGFCLGGDLLYCPTLQMAMKWLREVHNTIIIVRLFNSAEHFYPGKPNQFTTDIASPTMSPQEGHIRSCYSTYEQACEAAIKYCLEKLI